MCFLIVLLTATVRKYGKRRVVTKRRPIRRGKMMINMGKGYSKRDQRRVSERNAPHKCSCTFATLTNVRNCSPIFYDPAYSQTYDQQLTKMKINVNSVVYKNYAIRYAEYKVDTIDLVIYYNQEAKRVSADNPPAPIGGPNADITFGDSFFHFLYNPEKDAVPGEALGSIQDYDRLAAHPSTQIFRFRPPSITNNSQDLVPCFKLRVKPKVEKVSYIDGQATEIFVNHPFINTGDPPKQLYCGGLWCWTPHEVDERFAPIFFAEVKYNFLFRDSEFSV